METASQPSFLQKIPVNLFAIALGLLSLGNGWRGGAPKLGLSPLVGETILTVALVYWAILSLLYLAKAVRYPAAIWKEVQDGVQCCFVSLIPITTILAGLALKPYVPLLARVFLLLGILGQVLYATYSSAGLWRGTHTVEATTPAIYLPTVATNLSSAMALGAWGMPTLGYVFLGAGVLSWFSLEAAILLRLRVEPEMAPGRRPVLGIQLAPSFVACSAYLALNGGQFDPIALGLIGYGILNLLFLLRLLPWIMAQGFSLSLWAFSFGLGSMAGVGLKLAPTSTALGLPGLGQTLASVGSLGVLLLGVGTVKKVLE
ncbi:MAG: dicarboxylate transporter/tellurite-resistance protein TehA [Acidaminococcus sp.]|uniref:dicarboxylate transporter/tellurite-resistance protein TehA n=1 Tax=Acidaminococcus sp. TaxID=1872103 RepID=UPI003F171729